MSILLLFGLFLGHSRPMFSQPAPPSLSNLAPTPPMGWASWNHFFCDYNDQTIREQADALVSTGMRDLGYKYVLIQECIAPARNANGNLMIDSNRFPHGMESLVNYIHARGLKAGIYTDVGPYTCYPNPRYQGSYGHEDQDAKTFAAWGMDLIEMDYCHLPAGHSGREIYERMASAIKSTGRPMLFYICSWGNEKPWTWAQGKAQLWRTDGDISSKKNYVEWANVVRRFESNARHVVFSAPDSWNDPDMLEVGNRGLNTVEAQSHFSMWAISSAPLWAGNDLTDMTASIHNIYTNREVIAVDQDFLGAGATKLREDTPGVEVWSKPLGSIGSGVDAVLLLNLTEAPADVAVRWRDVGLSGKVLVRDLYTHGNLSAQPEGYRTRLRAHGSVLLKVSGNYTWSKGATYEAEWPGNLRAGNAVLLECPKCSQGYAVSLTSPKSTSDASTITFTHISAPNSGRYRMNLYYAYNSSANGNLQMRVNGGQPVQVSLSRFIHGPKTLPVELNQGTNSIAFSSAQTTGANVSIDRLSLYR